MRVHNRGRTEVLTVRPEHGARRGTRGAQDALCGVVKPCAVLNGLQTLTFRLIAVINEERHDLAVRLEERLHVHDQVLLTGQALNRLDRDRLGHVEVFQQGLARQTVTPVNAHCVRTADAVRAGAPE